VTYLGLWETRFSHGSRSKSCGLWRCVIGRVTPELSKDHSTFIVKVKKKALKSLQMSELLVQWHSVTPQMSTSSWCQDITFSQLQSPFHSLSKGMVLLLQQNTSTAAHNNYAGTTGWFSLQLTHTILRASNKFWIQIYETVNDKAPSWCLLHDFKAWWSTIMIMMIIIIL
jgi:hypothetical protein